MKKLSALLAAAVALSAFSGFAAAPASAASILVLTDNVPGHTPRHPGATGSTYECSAALGHLRRVYEEQLDLVENVSVTPVCENEDYGVMRSDGNAGALRQHIGLNDTMVAALQAANFRVEDVVGIRMTGDESAILFVHPFHYR